MEEDNVDQVPPSITYVTEDGRPMKAVYRTTSNGMTVDLVPQPLQGQIFVPAAGESHVVWTPYQPAHWKDEKAELERKISDLERELNTQNHRYDVCMSNYMECRKSRDEMEKDRAILHHALMMSLFFMTIFTIDHEITTKRAKDMEMSPEQTAEQRDKIVKKVFNICYEDLNNIVSIHTMGGTAKCRDLLVRITVKVQERLKSKGSLREVFESMGNAHYLYDPYRIRQWTKEICSVKDEGIERLAQSIADILVHSILRRLVNYV